MLADQANRLQIHVPQAKPPAPDKIAREAAAKLRCAFLKVGLVYSLLIVYSSTVIGPVGLNFVLVDLHTAWHEFLAVNYLPKGSLVRSDWVGNLLMLVPLGYISTGTLWPQRSGLRRGFAVVAALGFCLIFLLAIKFAQLFFPPRTVALDYIIAQSLGALAGVVLFVGSRQAFARLHAGGRRAALTVALGTYALALLGFLLFPFDFVLSRSDLHQRLAELPHLLFAVPGAGRQFPWVMIAAVFAAVETAPLGMLIGFHCRRHCVLVAGVIGLCGMAGICLLQMVILGATPSIIAVLYRSFGIVAGAVTVRSITVLRLLRWRLALARAVPGLALFYLLAVLLTKDVAGADWRTPEEAWAALDVSGLWPFWHAYIVSKPHAVRSIIAHVVMYAPIGVMVWLCRGDRQHGRVLATTLAVTLSIVVEIGRWFRPGLQPDFTNLIIAGCAAWFAIPLSEWMWRALAESFPIPGPPPVRGPSTLSTRIGEPARMPREAG